MVKKHSHVSHACHTHIVLVPILACISCRLWVVCAARSARTGTHLYCGHAYCRHSGAISCMGERFGYLLRTVRFSSWWVHDGI